MTLTADKISDDKVNAGKFWAIVISSLEDEVTCAAVRLPVPGVVFTRENCLKTWDNAGFPVWWGNIGTACCMWVWKFWFWFNCDEAIEIICELLFPAAVAFANKDLTVWFDELMLDVVPLLVRFAMVETTCGFDWAGEALKVKPELAFEANFNKIRKIIYFK